MAATVAAAGLNAALFVQTALAQIGPGGVDQAILSIINAFAPGATLQPPAVGPSPSPGVRPIVTTGGS